MLAGDGVCDAIDTAAICDKPSKLKSSSCQASIRETVEACWTKRISI
jgi:hypothetical protein